MSKKTALHVHHAFLQIGLLSLHNYDVKWPNIMFCWERERQNDKFYHLFLTRARSSFFSSNLNSLILSNRTTWDNREKEVWKDAKATFLLVFMDVTVAGS